MKSKLKKILRSYGYDLIRYKKDELGTYPYQDMKKFITVNHPIIFDVGANIGQSIDNFREILPSSYIHAFEPSKITFEILSKKMKNEKNLILWNFALGATKSKNLLHENTHSTMNSFLELGEDGWGSIKDKNEVIIDTIDEFCINNKIEKIDIIKSDTQGYNFEVLKGAKNMFMSNKVGLVFFEFTFSKMYNNLPLFGDIYNYLNSCGFHLVTIYPFAYQKNKLAGWTDVLFVHKSYL